MIKKGRENSLSSLPVFSCCQEKPSVSQKELNNWHLYDKSYREYEPATWTDLDSCPYMRWLERKKASRYSWTKLTGYRAEEEG